MNTVYHGWSRGRNDLPSDNRKVANSVSVPLSVERIVTMALSMAQRGGDPPGMREVAAALCVTPGALYKHVNGQSQLVELMIDAVMAEVPIPDDRDDVDAWSRIRIYVLSLTRVLDEHPGLDKLVAGYGDESAAARSRQRWFMQQLRSAGLKSDDAKRAYGAIHLYWLGSRQPPRRFVTSFEFGLDCMLEGVRRHHIDAS